MRKTQQSICPKENQAKQILSDRETRDYYDYYDYNNYDDYPDYYYYYDDVSSPIPQWC